MKMCGAKVRISIVRLMEDVFERKMSRGKRKALSILCSHWDWISAVTFMTSNGAPIKIASMSPSSTNLSEPLLCPLHVAD